MKKKWFCAWGLVFLALLLPARDEEKRTLFGSRVSHGFFFATECKWTRFQDQDDILIGSKLAWVVDRRLILGVGGYAALNWNDWEFSDFDYSHDFVRHDYRDWDAGIPRLAYGGLILGFHAMPDKPVDIYSGILIGGGFMHANEKEWVNAAADWERNEFFWVCEPEIQLLLSFTRFLQIGVGGSYRWISGVTSQWTSRSKLQGAGIQISIRLGWM